MHLPFVHSIMSLDNENTSKIVFIQRAQYYFENLEQCRQNTHRSTVFDLLNTVYTFDMSEDVRNMVYRGRILSRAHRRGRKYGKEPGILKMYTSAYIVEISQEFRFIM